MAQHNCISFQLEISFDTDHVLSKNRLLELEALVRKVLDEQATELMRDTVEQHQPSADNVFCCLHDIVDIDVELDETQVGRAS